MLNCVVIPPASPQHLQIGCLLPHASTCASSSSSLGILVWPACPAVGRCHLGHRRRNGTHLRHLVHRTVFRRRIWRGSRISARQKLDPTNSVIPGIPSVCVIMGWSALLNPIPRCQHLILRGVSTLVFIYSFLFYIVQ